MISVESVRKAATDDALAMSETLADAFYDDPFFRWMLPDDEHRARANREFFTLVVDILAGHDDGWTTHDGTGAALWVPHGREAMSAEAADRFVKEVTTLAGPWSDRMLGLFELADQHHPHEPHEYLFFVGVRPGAQGNGIGSALMAPVLTRADAAGHPCYLEASSPGSRVLYERLGFRAIAEVAPAGGPTFWPMVRDPR